MIDRRDYRRNPRNHKLMINIRLRAIIPGRKPTKSEVEKVLVQILEHNTVPLGWQVAFVEWGNPKNGDVDWKPSNGRGGDIGDIKEFYAVIMHELKRMRISIVRQED